MIYTVTFNPALDVSGDVDAIVPDEKAYVHGERISPGGNGINAGIIAARIGAQVTLTGFLGGSNGTKIRELLKKEKLETEFVPISGDTRMNVTVSARNTHRQTRLSFPGPRIRPGEKDRLAEILSHCGPSDLVVFGGSLPPGVAASDVKKIIRHLREKDVPFVIDMPGKILSGLIPTAPLMIKPNLTEFQELTGTTVSTIEDVVRVSRKKLSRIPFVCVSSVEGGALLITADAAWFGKIPKVKIRSSVGAGDSMVGAMAVLLEKDPQCPPEKLLRSGLAASCATLTEAGMTLGTKRSIREYTPKIIVKRGT